MLSLLYSLQAFADPLLLCRDASDCLGPSCATCAIAYLDHGRCRRVLLVLRTARSLSIHHGRQGTGSAICIVRSVDGLYARAVVEPEVAREGQRQPIEVVMHSQFSDY